MKLKELSLKDLMIDYDATKMYPSAIRDDNSIYLRTKTVYTFTLDMNDEIVEKFKSQSFT